MIGGAAADAARSGCAQPRNANNGGVEIYDIHGNQITGAAFMGTVGLDWQFSGIGNFSGAGKTAGSCRFRRGY